MFQGTASIEILSLSNNEIPIPDYSIYYGSSLKAVVIPPKYTSIGSAGISNIGNYNTSPTHVPISIPNNIDLVANSFSNLQYTRRIVFPDTSTVNGISSGYFLKKVYPYLYLP